MYPKNKKKLALFSYNPKSQRYEITGSIPEQMNDHFSMEEVSQFLVEPESELTQFYKAFPLWLNKLLRLQPVITLATLMKIAMALIGLSLLVLSETIKDKQTYITIKNILIILVLLCGFIAVTAPTVSYFWTRAKEKHAFKVMENIQAYIQETYSYYQTKGVVWSIPQNSIPSSVRHVSRDDDDEPKGHNIELWKYDQPNEHHKTHQRNSQSSARLIEEFLFNTDARKFISIYSPLRTDDQVSFEEVKQFLDLAMPSFSQYGKSLASLLSAGKWGFIGFVLMTIIFSFVLSKKVDGLSLATYAFIYNIIVILTVFCYIKNCQKKARAIIPNIQAIIEQTAPQINAKGFRWVLPLYHYKSVQLWEDRSPQIEHEQLPSQSNTGVSEIIENKDSEVSQGLWPTQTRDDLSLLREEMRVDVEQKDIVFLYDNKFLSHHYFSGLTQNKVSKAQIKTLLMEIESRFALKRRTCLSRFFRVFIFFTYFVGFVSAAVLLSSAYYPVFAISFTPVGMVVLGLVCRSLFRAHYSRLKKQMFEVIFQRAPEYDQKGLKWFISEGCSLTIVLRDKNAVGEPAIPYS